MTMLSLIHAANNYKDNVEIKTEQDDGEEAQPVYTIKCVENSAPYPDVSDVKSEEVEILDGLSIKQEEDEEIETNTALSQTRASHRPRTSSEMQDVEDYKQSWLTDSGDDHCLEIKEMLESPDVEGFTDTIKIEYPDEAIVGNSGAYALHIEYNNPSQIKYQSEVKPLCFTNPESNLLVYISGLPPNKPTQINPPVVQSVKLEPLPSVELFTESKPQATGTSPDGEQQRKRKYAKKYLKPAIVSEWVCVPCNRMFRNKGGLHQHNNSQHSGEKPFACKVCGKRFHNQECFEQHAQKHEKVDKPFKCNLCTKQYCHSYDLKRHVILHHTPNKRYTCRYCDKAFDRNDHVQDHETSHENGTVKRIRRNKKKSDSEK